eukprot:435357-Amorphochlora_amoeboformis.AAC.1
MVHSFSSHICANLSQLQRRSPLTSKTRSSRERKQGIKAQRGSLVRSGTDTIDVPSSSMDADSKSGLFEILWRCEAKCKPGGRLILPAHAGPVACTKVKGMV